MTITARPLQGEDDYWAAMLAQTCNGMWPVYYTLLSSRSRAL